MNNFILKHYFCFICDYKWHAIDFLDGVFCKTVTKYFGFSGGENEDGFFNERSK